MSSRRHHQHMYRKRQFGPVPTVHFLVQPQDYDGCKEVLIQRTERVVQNGNQNPQALAHILGGSKVLLVRHPSQVPGSQGQYGISYDGIVQGALRHFYREMKFLITCRESVFRKAAEWSVLGKALTAVNLSNESVWRSTIALWLEDVPTLQGA